MAKLKPLPRSNARTAWDLLQDVKRAITQEPRRADMSVFRHPWAPEDGGPACGTVGCFAGWVNILAGGRGEGSANISASNILGYYLNYHLQDRHPVPYHVFNNGTGDICATTRPGTRAHARAVVQRINRFMALNADALKARRLHRVDGRLVPLGS